MKTILVPNAPWPKWEPVPPKRSHHKKKKLTRSETDAMIDANFERWLKENTHGIRRR
jgi:hypothetical protein